ncbi:DUF3795 domain-containing protein [Ruminococcaceae bacterium OttesenSCG-928-I18]|nr:DUF3795 domain-containing protein [Ruminococcaceae bacterium OttesenSCG-928-I18]
MPSSLHRQLLAPCGVNCAACMAYLRKKNHCQGCLGPVPPARKSCQNCLRRNCAAEKGHAWCFECEDFPCKHIKTLDKSYRRRYHISLIEDGHLAAKQGVSALLDTHGARYRCPACGGIACQHDGICSECGEKVTWELDGK